MSGARSNRLGFPVALGTAKARGYIGAMADTKVTLRAATPGDAGVLAGWDREPHVIRCTTDNPDADVAFDGCDWEAELQEPTPYFTHLIGEVNGRPIGAMLIVDPKLEPTHYWGEAEPDQRAIDIWIGPADALGRGYGSEMMRQAIERCFAEPEITAILIDPLASNVAAHRFYRRLGFVEVGRRWFDEDDCLVHQLTRENWAVVMTGRRKRSLRS